MVTIRYSNQRDPSCDELLARSDHPRTSKACRHQDDGFRYELQFLLSRVRTVFPNLNNDKLYKRLSGVLLMHQSKVIKRDSKCFLAIGRLHKDNLLDTLQAMAPTNVKTISQTYREQPRSTRLVVACPRPAFSATKRTNHTQHHIGGKRSELLKTE